MFKPFPIILDQSKYKDFPEIYYLEELLIPKFFHMIRQISLTIVSFLLVLFFASCSGNSDEKKQLENTQKILGLEFTQSELDSILLDVDNQRKSFQSIRQAEINNAVPPSLVFDPRPVGFEMPYEEYNVKWMAPKNFVRPSKISDIAFLPVSKLSVLIRTRQITSVELTNIYLNRLENYADTLECLVTLTKDLALEQAKKADAEIARGEYRGPLHGIPYGVKDLLAVPGYKTTWGAGAYKEQVIDETATVVKKLEEAGAVLLGKLTLGALAMGDVWFDGVTKNPWDLEQGSSGSSAGSASATSAGLVGFSIGTETWGSIVSPATRCGVSGLRPTFGRVSRHGAMALSWTMDKIGPICRSAEDCLLVFNVINGKDEKDPFTVEAPFVYDDSDDISSYKVAYLKDLFENNYRGHEQDSLTLKNLQELGVQMEAISLPDEIPVNAMGIILEAEAAAAFNQLTLTNADDELAQQHRYAWPNIFRKARFVPAVEYIQASRLRTKLQEQVHALFSDYDVIIAPSFGGNQLLMTNLTGQPCLVIPNGFDKKGRPTSISFLGNLYDEGKILKMAKVYQENTDFDEQHPDWLKE